jgi:hypothetical protein
MVSKDLRVLVEEEGLEESCKLTVDGWVRGVIRKLTEITHGMWIY